MKSYSSILIGILLVSASSPPALARGFGGGRYGGGGYSGGGYGGYRGGEGFGYSSVSRGGTYSNGVYRPNGNYNGAYHSAGYYGGYRGDSFYGSGYRSTTGAGGYAAYRGGGYGYGAYHAGAGWGYAGGHMALPSDGGFAFAGGAARSTAFTGIANRTIAMPGSVMAARGVAVRNGFNRYDAFGADWYAAHPGAWAGAGWLPGAAWNAAIWPAIGTWCGWGGDVDPVPYVYGENIVYQDGQVYAGGQPVASAQAYYQQALGLAQSVPAPPADNPNWMPLGVYSLVQGNQSNTTVVFQLALSKSGAIGGNYYAVLTDTSLPVRGAVNSSTQRVAWTVAGNQNTVFDTGMSSLVQQQAPVLVHLSPTETQQWMLVRLRRPQ